MDGILKQRLTKIADYLSEDGFEEAIMDRTAEEYADLEQLLTSAISTAEGVEFNKLIQIRHLFRIVVKFHTDINRGLNRIREFEFENQR